MGFLLVSKSVTLNDLERRSLLYSTEFGSYEREANCVESEDRPIQFGNVLRRC